MVCWRFPGGAGGKGVWGAAGMVYEDEEPDARDPNYDESAQVRRSVEQAYCSHKPAALLLFGKCLHYRSSAESVG